MFMFSEKGRRRTRGKHWLGLLKLRAFFRMTNQFSFILINSYYILKEVKVVQWQVDAFAMLMTWVRVPGLYYSQ